MQKKEVLKPPFFCNLKQNYLLPAFTSFTDTDKSSAIRAERPRKALKKYNLARRTLPTRDTSILATFGEYNGNTRSTPSPKEIFLTVKEEFNPSFLRAIHTPS